MNNSKTNMNDEKQKPTHGNQNNLYMIPNSFSKSSANINYRDRTTRNSTPQMNKFSELKP